MLSAFLAPTHTHILYTHTQSACVVRQANVRRHPLSMPSHPALLPSQERRAQNKSRSEQITRIVFSVSFSRRTWANGRRRPRLGQQLHFPTGPFG